VDYLAWNDLIATHFFRPEMAGRRVYLYVTAELISDLGRPRSGDLTGFIEAAKIGPPWTTRQGVCQKALQALTDWRSKGRTYPPYLGYLALFVLAAGVEGDFAPHAYYPRLRNLLGEEPVPRSYPSFDRMLELWDDLERWSNLDTHGRLGTFHHSIAGNWIHVGLPISQTLLTEHERQALPGIFAHAGVDPTSPPSDAELAALLTRYGRHELRRLTVGLLEHRRNEDHDVFAALIETLLDELRHWDGTIAPANGSRSAGPGWVYAALRLCCQLDTVSGRATFNLRCRSSHALPEDGLSLQLDGAAERFICQEFVQGWSLPICAEGGRIPVDAAGFNWLKSWQLCDTEQRWRLALQGSAVRVFSSGASEGLPGLVEVRQLPRATPIQIAVHEECRQHIERWGASCCKGFRKLMVSTGLPPGWHLFSADGATADDPTGNRFPILTLPVSVRLELDGGIRLEGGHQFFSFAPPRIILHGGHDDVEIYANGMLLDAPSSAGVYVLPEPIRASPCITIEVRLHGQTVSRRAIYLRNSFPWPEERDGRRFDRFGDAVAGVSGWDEPTSTGIAVTGLVVPAFAFGTVIPVPTEGRAFLVGKQPGQVVNWPTEPQPDDWSPVWAIVMRRRGRVVFCGSDIAEAEPVLSPCMDRPKLQLWKEVLWHRRRRITPPERSSLQGLWRRYQEVARRV
jgi:hypothetical protein